MEGYILKEKTHALIIYIFFCTGEMIFTLFNKNISQRQHIEFICNNSSFCFYTTHKMLLFDRELSGARFIKSFFFFFLKASFGRRPF